jgi:hypothetical protein
VTGPSAGGIRLWDDNPSLVDLLGFDAVVGPILEAVSTPHLDPVTIGVQSPWGGGKSTIINLLDDALYDDPRYVVIRTDPWQYDNHDDVRGVLIAEILDELRTHFDSNAAVQKRVEELLRRISWSRVAVAVGKGALGMSWSPKELLEAFTPARRSTPESMSGFKRALAELLDMLPDVERVVVLIDDLDRCLPPAVLGTLESIKLFLAVPKMVFVLAADQDLIRDAVAASLSGTNRSETFAQRYLEKIVQLPISLPRLSPQEAQTYIGLLLAHSEAPSEDEFAAVISHAATRRQADLWPLLSEWPDGAWRPSDQALLLAAQLAQGLGADKVASPRQIKRFLNAYGVRAAVAGARGITLSPSVLVKMLLLEDQHRPAFERLASWPATDRQGLLQLWERWARDEADAPPEGISETTRDWATPGPRSIWRPTCGWRRRSSTCLWAARSATRSSRSSETSWTTRSRCACPRSSRQRRSAARSRRPRWGCCSRTAGTWTTPTRCSSPQSGRRPDRGDHLRPGLSRSSASYEPGSLRGGAVVGSPRPAD